MNIGDKYNGGIVFYTGNTYYLISAEYDIFMGNRISLNINHKLILTNAIDLSIYKLTDNVMFFYGCNSTSLGSTYTGLTQGQLNTNIILSGCSELNTGAYLCDRYSTGGFNDWYLPSKEELGLLYTNRTIIGNFHQINDGGSSYMSSTEWNSTSFWALSFYFGTGSNDPKYDAIPRHRVRPIRMNLI